MILRFLLSLALLFVYLVIGEGLVRLLHVPVPGSVAGMVLLAASLHYRLLRVEVVRPAAEVLVRHMALLFVPPGVGLMLYFDLLRAEWFAITVATVASTAAVLLVVGHLQQRAARHD